MCSLMTSCFLHSAQNPLIFELTLDSVSSTAGINGTVYATFNHTFATPVVVPPLGKANSGVVPDVLLTQGAIASLDIIPLGYLDLINVDVNLRYVATTSIIDRCGPVSSSRSGP